MDKRRKRSEQGNRNSNRTIRHRGGAIVVQHVVVIFQTIVPGTGITTGISSRGSKLHDIAQAVMEQSTNWNAQSIRGRNCTDPNTNSFRNYDNATDVYDRDRIVQIERTGKT